MRRPLLFISACLFVLTASAQDDSKKVTLSGSIQSDILLPEDDDKIGAKKTDDVLTKRTISRDGACPTST